jgi:Tfp pilus assembly protein PilO
MIDRLSSRTALVIGAVGLLAVVLVGWFAVVSPQRSKASELDAKITESQTALALAESLNRADARRASSVEARALVRAMPAETQMSEILRQLSSAAKRTRVRVNSVTPQAAAPLSGYEALPMTVVVEGRYFGIANFLGALRTKTRVSDDTVRGKGRLYSVDQVQFAGNPEERMLQATMTLNAYRFSGAATAAAMPAATAATTSGSTSAAPATAP